MRIVNQVSSWHNADSNIYLSTLWEISSDVLVDRRDRKRERDRDNDDLDVSHLIIQMQIRIHKYSLRDAAMKDEDHRLLDEQWTHG